jgi:hypothetical protein
MQITIFIDFALSSFSYFYVMLINLARDVPSPETLDHEYQAKKLFVFLSLSLKVGRNRHSASGSICALGDGAVTEQQTIFTFDILFLRNLRCLVNLFSAGV